MTMNAAVAVKTAIFAYSKQQPMLATAANVECVSECVVRRHVMFGRGAQKFPDNPILSFQIFRD